MESNSNNNVLLHSPPYSTDEITGKKFRIISSSNESSHENMNISYVGISKYPEIAPFVTTNDQYALSDYVTIPPSLTTYITLNVRIYRMEIYQNIQEQRFLQIIFVKIMINEKD